MSGPGLRSDDAEYVDENPLDATDELGLFAMAVIACALIGWFILVGSFVYKVWNERQMTHAYEGQRAEQKRIADVMEFFAEEAKTAKARP